MSRTGALPWPSIAAMDTLPLDPVALVACDPARGIHRRWQVQASRDLFGRWRVETRWGRIGTGGRLLVASFADEIAALHHVRALLTRRSTALERIGVAYRPEAQVDG